MKKVIVVTKIGRNFGAVLQAYALKKKIEETGADVSILKYSLPATLQTYKALPRITGFASGLSFIKALRYLKQVKVSIARFLDFRDKYFDFTKEYKNYAELEMDPPRADIYVAGSDQVWNPKISFDKAYYLQFVGERGIRASYAASIGLSEIPKQLEEEFFQRISEIQYISVREKQAGEVLGKRGIDFQVNVDPTLLLEMDDYDQILIEPEYRFKYIVVYFLILPGAYQEYIKILRSIYPDHKIVSIRCNASYPHIGDIERADLGPREFVGLIKNASAVVTTSFHGTAFSLIYGKQFMAVLPNHTGGRISELLIKLGIKNRIASQPQDLSGIEDEIDYEKVRLAIQAEKIKAEEYLGAIMRSGDNDEKKEFA